VNRPTESHSQSHNYLKAVNQWQMAIENVSFYDFTAIVNKHFLSATNTRYHDNNNNKYNHGTIIYYYIRT